MIHPPIDSGSKFLFTGMTTELMLSQRIDLYNACVLKLIRNMRSKNMGYASDGYEINACVLRIINLEKQLAFLVENRVEIKRPKIKEPPLFVVLLAFIFLILTWIYFSLR
jgi:hypothetical protein